MLSIRDVLLHIHLKMSSILTRAVEGVLKCRPPPTCLPGVAGEPFAAGKRNLATFNRIDEHVEWRIHFEHRREIF